MVLSKRRVTAAAPRRERNLVDTPLHRSPSWPTLIIRKLAIQTVCSSLVMVALADRLFPRFMIGDKACVGG